MSLLHLKEEIEDGCDVCGPLRHAVPPVMPQNLPLPPTAEIARSCQRRRPAGGGGAVGGECLRQVQGLLWEDGCISIAHHV